MFETFTSAQLTDTFIVSVISSVVASIIFVIGGIIFIKPVFRTLVQAHEWWALKRCNQPLNIEVTLSGNIVSTNFQDFDKSIKTALSKMDDTQYLRSEGGIIKAKRTFAKFSTEIDIVPTPSYDSGDMDYLSISIKSKDVGLRDLKDCLFEIHTYLFRDLSIEINKRLKFSPLINKEGVKINFEQKPAMLDLIKGIDIKYLTSKDKDTEINIFPDNIKVIGKIGKDSIENIEYLIRKNIVT